MPGTFSPPPRVSDPDMHHGTCVKHVPWCMPGSLTSGFLWNRCRGKRSRHSRRMHNSEFCVLGKRPIEAGNITWPKQKQNNKSMCILYEIYGDKKGPPCQWPLFLMELCRIIHSRLKNKGELSVFMCCMMSTYCWSNYVSELGQHHFMKCCAIGNWVSCTQYAYQYFFTINIHWWTLFWWRDVGLL